MAFPIHMGLANQIKYCDPTDITLLHACFFKLTHEHKLIAVAIVC